MAITIEIRPPEPLSPGDRGWESYEKKLQKIDGAFDKLEQDARAHSNSEDLSLIGWCIDTTFCVRSLYLMEKATLSDCRLPSVNVRIKDDSDWADDWADARASAYTQVVTDGRHPCDPGWSEREDL